MNIKKGNAFNFNTVDTFHIAYAPLNVPGFRRLLFIGLDGMPREL